MTTDSADLYENFLTQAVAGTLDLSSDTLKMTLMGSGYTPDLNADANWSDISADEITGTGYTAGGITLTSVTVTATPAASWGPTWVNFTGYFYGQIVGAPSGGNGFLYRCVVAGVSGVSAPAFPTVVGATVTDGSVTWACVGHSLLVLTSDQVEWNPATFTANFAVLRDAQSGTPSTETLIALITFAIPQSPVASPFPIAPDPNQGWVVLAST